MSFDPLARLPAREQTADEQYLPPENWLEIQVNDPQTHGEGKDRWTDYQIVVNTNIPQFRHKSSKVRRRYSEFEKFRERLEREQSKVTIPSLPGKVFFASSRLDGELIEKRRIALEQFCVVVAGHPLLRTGSNMMMQFLQEPDFRISWS